MATKAELARLAVAIDLLAITSKLVRRAESTSVKSQFHTFATNPIIGNQLFAVDDQIVFGRRGSGKTHLFGWAAYRLQQQKQFALVVDYPEAPMVITSGAAGRALFSPASLYSLIRPLIVEVAQYAKTLATDRRTNVRIRDRGAFDKAVSALLSCADAIQFEYESSRTDVLSRERALNLDAGLGAELAQTLMPEANVRLGAGATLRDGANSTTTRHGTEVKVLDTGEISRAVADMILAIGGRFYLFIDEWSRIPIEHQPIVAEFIKRTFCTVPDCIVKIGAIQERSRFDAVEQGERLGIELSSDAFADINLDALHPARNFEGVRGFLLEMLFKHYKQVYEEHFTRTFPLKRADDLVGPLFASDEVFSEFVDACAGVPRDALNIIMKTAPFSGERPIGSRALRRGLLEWFRTDKQAFYKPNTPETVFLDWLKNKIVYERKSKGFLIDDGPGDQLIDNLRENRIIHLVNSSVSSKRHIGKRFKYYKLDYGCYVDLLETRGRPQHDLGEDVSVDEYGEIRYDGADEERALDRARSVILELEEFYTDNSVLLQAIGT
jgi:hypothetical protein